MLIRSRIIFFFIIIVFLFFFYRAYQLSFNTPLPKFFRKKTLEQVRRGSIFDSNQSALAISKDSASIGIRPVELIHPRKVSRSLALILGIPANNILSLIKKNKEKKFFWLKRKLESSIIPKIQKLKTQGVHIEIEPSRYYPNKQLASNIIGFVDIDNQGLGGIEFEYNSLLNKPVDESMVGHDIHLSIHSYIQFKLEKILRQSMLLSKSKASVGIISEVHTGKILAISSLPGFDPQNIQESQEKDRKNRAVNSIYEPGSTFKIFTLAALIENRLLKKDWQYFCPGYIVREGFKIRCNGVHQHLDIGRVIKKSCNVGIIEAALGLPPLYFFKSIRSFGFGSLTNINLPGESRGLVSSPRKWDASIKMSIPIGHGLAVTPIQMIAAANSIANGGRLLKPQIIERITNSNGDTIYQLKPEEKNITISPASGQKVLDYLQAVTAEGGTGEEASLELVDLRTAGKTGTSIKSDRTGYLKDKYQASFLGFFPAKKPKITMFILFDEPEKGIHQGGKIAAPVFRKVLRETFSLVYTGEKYRIHKLPDIDFNMKRDLHRHGEFKPERMPNFIGRSKKDALQILLKYYPGGHTLSGAGYVLRQSPSKGTRIKKPYAFTLRFGFLN